MSDSARTTLLFLSGGCLVGLNIMQTLAARRDHLRLVATNSVPDEPTLDHFDEVYLVPETLGEPSAFEKRFLHIFEEAEPALVIPCRDDDVFFLSDLAERRPDLVPKLLCGSREVGAAMLDKWESWQFSERYDLPFAPSVLATDREAVDAFVSKHGLPLLVKPRSGFGSRGIHLVLEYEALEAVLGDESVVIQKYLGDPDVLRSYRRSVEQGRLPLYHSFETIKRSAQAMIGPDGEVAAFFANNNTMRRGMSWFVEEDTDPEAVELGRYCARVFAEAGWRGPLNIQSQRAPDGKLYIYEFSGRFTGATAARWLLGFDDVAIALRLFANLALPESRTDHLCGAVGKKLVSFAARRRSVESLQRRGVWHAGGGRQEEPVLAGASGVDGAEG